MKGCAMITTLLTATAAIEVLLVILEGTVRVCRKVLPLGGSHLAQIGVLFGGAVAGWELIGAIRAFAGL